MISSEELFAKARLCLPGGVNSPVRAFKSVGGTPVFFNEGKGAYLIDVDGKHYIDYVGSWGPLILGHGHPRVRKAVEQTLSKGFSFGATTPLELTMAEKLISLVPAVEKVRMVNSGTEATMTAIRMARGLTGRDKILKFKGCYHGHSDSLLSEAGSGLLTLGIPSSPGVPKAIAELTLTAPFNDLSAVQAVFDEYGDEIACVIVEPVAGNMGCILPNDGFLQGLRRVTHNAGSLLIFDEVMTGFRVALGGAQALYGVEADLVTFGKVIGGGLPVGAVAGKSEFMDCLAPEGDVYQAGTLSGNPIALSAGLATLTEIEVPGFFESLEANTASLVYQLRESAQNHGIPLAVSHVGGMFGISFSDKESLTSFDDINASDIAMFNRFFKGMLDEGIYFAPSAYEAGFVSSAHGEEEIALTVEAADRVFARIK